jgi:PadR family transcriptional regulator PadR
MERDRYGYEIIEIISTRSHGRYSIKQPTLYNALKRLEKLGFVESYYGEESNGGRRRYYCLTEKGTKTLTTGQKQWEFSRTILDTLLSDKDVDLATVDAPYDPNSLRPATKRIRAHNFNNRIPTSEADIEEAVDKNEESESKENAKLDAVQSTPNSEVFNTDTITLQITDNISIQPLSPLKSDEIVDITPISNVEETETKDTSLIESASISTIETNTVQEAGAVVNSDFKNEEIEKQSSEEINNSSKLSDEISDANASNVVIEEKNKIAEDEANVQSSINEPLKQKNSVSAEHEKSYLSNDIIHHLNEAVSYLASREILKEEQSNIPKIEGQLNLWDNANAPVTEGVVISKEALATVALNNELLETIKATVVEIAAKSKKDEKSSNNYNAQPIIIKDFSNHPLFRKENPKSITRSENITNEIDPLLEARKLNAADRLGLRDDENKVMQRAVYKNTTVSESTPAPTKVDVLQENANGIDYSAYIAKNATRARKIDSATYDANVLARDEFRYKNAFDMSLKPDIDPEIDLDIEKQDYASLESRRFKELKSSLAEEGYKIRVYSKPDAINYYNLNYILGNKILRDTAIFLYMFIVIELLSIYIAYEYFNYAILTLTVIACILFLVPITAIFMWKRNPAKRTKAKFNFTSNLIYSLILLVLVIAVITVTTLFLDNFSSGAAFVPYILSLNIPIATTIYYLLYKSKSYHIKGQ